MLKVKVLKSGTGNRFLTHNKGNRKLELLKAPRQETGAQPSKSNNNYH